MASYQPQKSDKFAFGLWTIMNTGRDPFGEATRERIDPLDVITELGKRGVWGIEMHAEDLIPPTATAAERDRLIKEANKRMADQGMACVNCGANVFAHPVYKDGALTSHDPKVRQLALQRYLNSIDVGVALGSKLCDLWWGRDGAEVDAAKEPLEAIKWLREGLNYLQSYIDKQGYTGYRLAIEPKPNEPRGDIYMPTVGHALGLIATLNKPENCGLVVEIAHSRMAGLNTYHDVAQAIEVGKLFGCHFNAQKPLRYDQDQRFGSEDLKESFFVVKLVEDTGWQGARSFDAHAFRSSDREEVWDFVSGCMRTYLILKEKVQKFNKDPEIQAILKELRSGAGEPLPPHDQLKKIAFDADQLARRRLHHERLDQLTQELLLGVR
ncbi:MAG TPA: TIM barrel protein [Phycisphaerae bacterium]|nr:TIM barrel protein [Phycisphaerae bacterium]HRY69987.1 TIM barrel protein [Phycisphaerae bacterium]HSA27196.1 TIM barrel protein [Phycisphaerae bacterium]